jgi:hypothetical protein
VPVYTPLKQGVNEKAEAHPGWGEMLKLGNDRSVGVDEFFIRRFSKVEIQQPICALSNTLL